MSTVQHDQTTIEAMLGWLQLQLVDDEVSVLSGDCRCADGEPQRPDCPDRVLAQVAAHRAILDDIVAEKHWVLEDDCWYTCPAATEERDGGETCNENAPAGVCDCGRDARVARRVKLLAAMYAGRDGYVESWRPA